jgi:hypothetical protein
VKAAFGIQNELIVNITSGSLGVTHSLFRFQMPSCQDDEITGRRGRYYAIRATQR